MNYTDKELIRASQIAYFTINDQVIYEMERWNESENGKLKANYALSELYDHSKTFRYSIYDSITRCIGNDEYVVTENSNRENVLSIIKDEKVKNKF